MPPCQYITNIIAYPTEGDDVNFIFKAVFAKCSGKIGEIKVFFYFNVCYDDGSKGEFVMISMMEAYNIEALKKDGYTYESVVERIDLDEDERIASLKALYEKDASLLKEAFTGNYRVSFVTRNGLRNILHLRYDIPLDSYKVEENGIFDIEMNEDVEKEVAAFISMNWTLKREENRVSIFVEGKK